MDEWSGVVILKYLILNWSKNEHEPILQSNANPTESPGTYNPGGLDPYF